MAERTPKPPADSTGTVTASRLTIAFWVVSLAFVLGAAVLRGEACRDALWIDEWITAWTIAGGWAEITPRAELGHAHPLYFWLVAGMGQGLGLNPGSLRVLSLLAGLGTILLISWIVFQETGRLLAVAVALALATLDQNFVFYASEARPYALLQCFGLLQVWVCLLTLAPRTNFQCPPASPGTGTAGDRSNSPAGRRTAEWRAATPGGGAYQYWLATVLLSSLLVLLHYTAILLLAAESVWLTAIAVRSRRLRGTALQLLAAVGLGASCLLLSRSTLLASWNDRANWASFVDLRSFGDSLQFAVVAYGLPTVLAGLGIWQSAAKYGEVKAEQALSASASLGSRSAHPRPWWFAVAVIGTLLSGVVVAQWAGIVTLAHYRYTIAISGLYPVLVGVALGRTPRRWGQLLSGVCLAAAGWYFVHDCSHLAAGQWQRPLRYERWNVACRRIEQPPRSGLPVVVFPNLIEDERISAQLSPRETSYFLAPMLPLFQTGDATDAIFPAAVGRSAPLLPAAVSAIATARGGWLVIRSGWGSGTEPPELVAQVASAVVTQLGRHAFAARWRLEPIPNSTVYLVRIEPVR